MSARLLALAMLLLTAIPSAATPPIGAPPVPPSPCETITPTPPPVTAFYRANPYDYTRYYDVDRIGPRMPRVLVTPLGDPFIYVPQPYLSNTVNPQYFNSYHLGTPYRSAP
jgi:hypothetical protein